MGEGMIDIVTTERSIGSTGSHRYHAGLKHESCGPAQRNRLNRHLGVAQTNVHSVTGNKSSLRSRAPINIEIKNNNKKKAVAILD